MGWLPLRRFRGNAILYDPESAKVQHDSSYVPQKPDNLVSVSLRHVLSLLNILLADETRFKSLEKKKMSDEKKTLATVKYGVQVLIARGFDYSAETRELSHFSRRLRDVAYRGRTGPMLRSRRPQNELKAPLPLADGILEERMNDFSEEELQNLMTVLSSSLVFKNYNRSIRIMHCFFSNPKPSKSSTEAFTREWLMGDLYSIGGDKMLKLDATSPQFAADMLDQYRKANESLESIKSKTIPIYKTLEPIQAHPEGGRLRSKRTFVVLSRSYVIFVLVFSVVVAILNFANRDNVFERVFDAVQVSTLLLVTIFGLVKLTSEDPNVIRNNFLGYRVVRSARDVVRAWGLESEDQVKKALAYSKHPQEWLDREGTCYVVAGRGRGIMLSHGIETRLLYEIGGDFDFNRYFRDNDTKGHFVEVESVELETTHIRENDFKHLYPILSVAKGRISVVGTMNCK